MNHILGLSGQASPVAKPGPVFCHLAPSGSLVSGMAAGVDHSATSSPPSWDRSENLCQRNYICDSQLGGGKPSYWVQPQSPSSYAEGPRSKCKEKVGHLGFLGFYRSMANFQFPISQRKLKERARTFQQRAELVTRKGKDFGLSPQSCSSDPPELALR